MATTEEAITRYGGKKMMFGTDLPVDGTDTYLCNPKGERSLYQDYLHVLPEKITAEAYEDLMWRNAVRVFGLKEFEGR
jgi:predicted TIM-barrel fold metal-dependent hydrolase